MKAVESKDVNAAASHDDLNVINSKAVCCRGSWVALVVAMVFIGGVAALAFVRTGEESTETGSNAPAGIVITEGETLADSDSDASGGGESTRSDNEDRPITDYLDDHPVKDATHPLDPPLEVARRGLEYLRANISDYTATVVKRERINGKLADQERIFAKVRHEARRDGKIAAPRSIYLKFLEPNAIKGREAIWVEGDNDGRLIGHDTGPLGVVSARLKPDSQLAMRGNRYPISEFGIEILIVRMLERGDTSRDAGRCEVRIKRNASINGRKCTMMIFEHPDRDEDYQFHLVHIFVDDELNVPVRYAMYSWPETKGGEPVLEEEYTYTDIKINVGLTDNDFDPANEEYAYPSRMLTL